MDFNAKIVFPEGSNETISVYYAFAVIGFEEVFKVCMPAAYTEENSIYLIKEVAKHLVSIRKSSNGQDNIALEKENKLRFEDEVDNINKENKKNLEYCCSLLKGKDAFASSMRAVPYIGFLEVRKVFLPELYNEKDMTEYKTMVGNEFLSLNQVSDYQDHKIVNIDKDFAGKDPQTSGELTPEKQKNNLEVSVCRRWTDEEVNRLVERYKNGDNIVDIANELSKSKELYRSAESVKQKIKNLGLSREEKKGIEFNPDAKESEISNINSSASIDMLETTDGDFQRESSEIFGYGKHVIRELWKKYQAKEIHFSTFMKEWERYTSIISKKSLIDLLTSGKNRVTIKEMKKLMSASLDDIRNYMPKDKQAQYDEAIKSGIENMNKKDIA